MKGESKIAHSIRIREAEDRDFPSTLAIYNDVVLNTTAIYENETQTFDAHRKWLGEKRRDGFPVHVAVRGEDVVGYCCLGQFRQRFCYFPSVEHSLHIAKASRGQGLGDLMLHFLIQNARERKFHSLIGGIDSENKISIHLHEKHGFKKAGELFQVAYKFDRWLDLTFMQLVLP